MAKDELYFYASYDLRNPSREVCSYPKHEHDLAPKGLIQITKAQYESFWRDLEKLRKP